MGAYRCVCPVKKEEICHIIIHVKTNFLKLQNTDVRKSCAMYVIVALRGNISTRGKSVPDLQEELTQRLSRFLSEPVVTVTVKEVLGN